MKKLILTLFLSAIITLTASAPPSLSLVIVDAPVLHSTLFEDYNALAQAIAWYETRMDTTIVNVEEQAYGAFQIRQCKLDEYNRQVGTNYVLEDCKNYTLSKQIFMHFAEGKSYEQAAKDWNGSGPMVIIYWDNVKKLI